MKLAFCLFNYDGHGGLSKDFIAVATEALKRGHSVDVYTQSWRGEKLKGLSIHLVKSLGWTNHGRSKRFAALALAAIEKRDIDCVLGFNRMQGLDYYFCADSSFIQKARRSHGALYRFTARYRCFSALESSVFATNKKTRIFNLAPSLRDEYQTVHGTQDNRFIDVPPAVDVIGLSALRETFSADAFRAELGVKPEERLLLMVGSSFVTKGVDRSIRALAALNTKEKKKSKLFIVGQGREAPLKKLAKTLDVEEQVFFIGPSERVFEWMLSADLLLHPSRVEAAGSVIVEALACGLPVLVSDSCGFSFHVERAVAGKQIKNNPYNQETFNALLLNARSQLAYWGGNASEYASVEPLHGRAKKILDELERV